MSTFGGPWPHAWSEISNTDLIVSSADLSRESGIDERTALDSQGQPVKGPSEARVLEAAFFQSLSFRLFHISKEVSVNIDI